MCLTDTGARFSTLDLLLSESEQSVLVKGFSGELERWPLSQRVNCTWNHLHFKHSFLVSEQYPVSLLGRDILCNHNVSILMFPDKAELIFPDGFVQTCATVKEIIGLKCCWGHQVNQTNREPSNGGG